MKNVITQVGITLVALVVTIVVLLILAGVTITYVFSDNGILSRAQTAAKSSDTATVLEEIQQRLLAIQAGNGGSYSNDDVHDVIEAVTGNDVKEYAEETTTKNGNTIDISNLWTGDDWRYDKDGNVTNGTLTLKIGDYVDYESEDVDYTHDSIYNGVSYYSQSFGNYTGNWQVLGVDEDTGNILLISSISVGNIMSNSLECFGDWESDMNYIGSLYGTGVGAVKGRSVSIEDINKITGYDPEIYAGSGTISEYGNEVTYTLNSTSGYIDYQGTKYPTSLLSSDYYTSLSYFDGSEWLDLEKRKKH